MSHRTARYVISVLARDRVGIIADVSAALYALDANLEALSQTVVWDWFTMIVCAAFPPEVTAEAIQEAVEAAGGFRAIVVPSEEREGAPPAEGEPFVVTAIGSDKPGIVKRLTQCFAACGVNIEDVWNEVRDEQFIVIFHVTVPRTVDPKELRHELAEAANELGMTTRLQHQDIFTATNSLSVHTKR